MTIKSGQHVTAGPRLIRLRTGDARKWLSVSKKPITGIYIGYRYYKNGTVDWDWDQVPVFYQQGPKIKVALIVPNDRENPIPVLFNSMVPA